MTLMKMYGDFQKGQYQEKNLRYGVREHGMGAIANGIALHNPGMIPYCATFFNFTDYMRGAIRMSALSRVTLSLMCHCYSHSFQLQMLAPFTLLKDFAQCFCWLQQQFEIGLKMALRVFMT